MKKKPAPPAAAAAAAPAPDLRSRAEERLKCQALADDPPQSEADHARMVHELQVHQIELEMQNEELQRAHAETEEVLAQYTDLYDFSPTGYLSLDHLGTILKINLTGARLLGMDRSQLMGRRFGPLLAEGSRRAFGDFLHKVLAGGVQEVCEVELPQAGAAPHAFRIEGALSPNGQECRAVLLDIAPRRQAEAALLASEVRYRRLFESAKDGILILDAATGMVLNVNPFLMELLGYSHENFLGKKVWELGFLKDLVANQASFAQLQQIESMRYEAMTLETSAGRHIEVELILTAFAVNDQKVIQCNLRDISERLRTKAAIRERMKELKCLYALRAQVQTDASLAEVCSEAAAQLVPAMQFPEITRAEVELLGQRFTAGHDAVGPPHGLQAEIRIGGQKHGQVGVYYAEERAFLDPFEQNLVNGVAEVLSLWLERQQTQAALQASELFAHDVLDSLSAHIAVLDEQGTIVAVNDAWRRFARENGGVDERVHLGANYLSVCQKAIEAQADEWADAAWRGIRAVLEGTQATFSLEYPCHSSRVERWFSMIVRPLGGARRGAVIAHETITERRRAEAALRASESRFRMLVENIPQKYCVKDRDSRWLAVNPSFARDLGFKREEVVGKLDYDLFPKEMADKYRADDQRIMQSGQTEELEEQSRLAGREVWVHMVKAPLRDERGEVIGIFGLFTDITERMRAAEALRVSEEKYRGIFDDSVTAIYLFDTQKRFLDTNEAGVKLLGYTREELLRLSMADVDADPTVVLPAHQELLAGGRLLNYEHRLRRKDNTVVTVLNNSKAITDPQGKVVGLLSTLLDITERMRVEESHTRLVTAVEAAAETIVITDAKANILYANPAFAKTTGYTCAEALGQNPRLLQSGKHDVEFYRQMWATLKAGEVWAGRFTNKRKDGTLYEEEASISPVFDAAGRIVNYVAVKRDITHEVQLEAQFRQAQKMEAVGRLAGGVAHDYNNMLAVVLMNASLLSDDQTLTPEQADGIQEITKAAERGAKLTQQLLTFSRRQVTQSRALNLNEVVVGVTRMLQQLIGEDVKLQTNLAPGAAPVWADPSMMEQVLMNLAVNARDALPAGGQITITVGSLTVDAATAAARKVQAGAFFRLTVRDNGTGIPPEHLPHIFEPFFTTKDVGQGTGLGLATVYGIVEQHQGWIEVESHLGQGTAFHIHLPCLAVAAPAGAKAPARPRPRGGSETILLVEDAEGLRKMAALCLTQYGYRVLPAASGAAALELWRQHPGAVDLLLTDIIMPDGVSGGQLAQQLQAEKPGLKVFYMSGYPGDVAGRGGLELHEGVNFLQKPFTGAKLAQTVRDCLDRGL